MKWLLTFALFLLVPIFTSTAQEITETPSEGWPVEQRCLPEPTTPPDDWLFEGAILMRGWAGIHTVSREYDTPYVVIFIDENETVDNGTLSPDGKWFALPIVDASISDMGFTGGYNLREIRIYSTFLNNVVYEFPAKAGYLNFGIYGESWVTWLDNETIIYFDNESNSDYTVLHPFTGEQEVWDGVIPELPDNFENDLSIQSYDGRYVASLKWYQTTPTNPDGSYLVAYHLEMLDNLEEKSIDLCISTNYGLAWSPNRNQLAMMGFGTGQQPVMILDMDTGELYTVAYHSGYVISWRAGD